mmetsp:Transcript_34161/g.88192  ORF Transcript_34161/g.88192 Transcript_34161/m.88192 type:complete len:583 (-) Transcript_34161:165-1913(-)
MGSVVVRQKRVQSYTCIVPTEFQGRQLIGNCLSAYTEAAEATEDLPYIAVANTLNISKPWVPAFVHNPDIGYPFSGANNMYSGGGYGIYIGGGVSNDDVAGDINSAQEVVEALHDNRWIDINTRATAITLTVFNPNINYFIFVDLVTEFPPSGGLVPSVTLRPVRLYQYYTSDDFLRLSFEVICVLFLGYYAGVEIMQAKDDIKEYIKDLWNFADVINILLFVAQVVFRIVTQVLFLQMNYDPANSDEYDLASISSLIIRTEEITAVNAFLMWFRFFRYFSESDRLNQLVKTIGYALVPTVGFLFIIALFLTAFSHAGFIMFGPFIPELRTFADTFLALFRGMFGGIEYESFVEANPIMGPIFFILFQTWMSIFMVQLVIAILIDSYREATRDEYVEGFDFPPFVSLYKELKAFFEKMKKSKKKKIADEGDAENFGGYGGKWAKQAEEDEKKKEEEKKQEEEKKKKKRRRGSGEGLLVDGAIASQEELQKLQSNLEQRLTNVESRLEKRIGDIEKIFVTTVAPIVETLDLMLKKQGEAVDLPSDLGTGAKTGASQEGTSMGAGGGAGEKRKLRSLKSFAFTK